MSGTETWAALPPEAWPDSWYRSGGAPKRQRPVARLLRALCGHPGAGAFWETRCDKAAREVGFAPIANWPSCYFHAKLKLLLAAYVDDFKMSGPQVSMARGWKLTQSRLNLGDPAPSSLYLGCMHECKQLTLNNGKRARAVVYNMEECLKRTAENTAVLSSGTRARSPP